MWLAHPHFQVVEEPLVGGLGRLVCDELTDQIAADSSREDSDRSSETAA